MNALSKGILWVVGALVVLGIIASLGLNLYLKSPATQAQIEDAIGDALGMPIEITSTSLAPWSDLRINGIRIPGPEGSGTSIGEAPSFTARYRLLPLFSKELVITSMTLDTPKLAWRQNGQGRWAWPPAKKEKEERKEKKKKRKGEQLEGESTSGFQVLIDGLKVEQGTLELQDVNGVPVAIATGVNLDFTRLAAHDMSGTLAIEKITWGTLVFEQVTSPFRVTEEGFELPELAAQLASGDVRGSVKLEGSAPDALLTGKLTLARVDLAKLAAQTGWTNGTVSGALHGQVEMRGPSADLAQATGRGHLELERGQFRQNELFQTIGEVLAIDELVNLRLASATADFRIADEKVFIEPLTLVTSDLRVTAKGNVHFDKKINLAARLAVSETVSKRLPGFIRESFSAADSERVRAIDFNVSGRTNKPKTDLAEQLVGRKVGEEVQDLLSGLFGVKKKKNDSKEEKKDSERKEEKKRKKAEKSADMEAAAARASSAAVLEAPAPAPAAPPLATDPAPGEAAELTKP